MTSRSLPDPSASTASNPAGATPPGDEIVVEAATTEEALARVSSRLGPDAVIVAAEKVHRGGVAGFFTKEMVKITARPRHASAAAGPSPEPPPATATGPAPAPTSSESGEQPAGASGGIGDVLERLQADVDNDEENFQTVLRRHLGVEETMPEAAPSAVTAGDAQTRPQDDVETAEDRVARRILEGLKREHAVPATVGGGVGANTSAATTNGSGTARLRTVPPTPTLGRSAQQAPSTPPDAPAAQNTTAALPCHVPDVDAVPGTGRVRWSRDVLFRLGLAESIVDDCTGLDESDDLGWLAALGRAVATYCRPLPRGSAVLAGPKAHRLADGLDLPAVKVDTPPPYGGSVCLQVRDTPRGREWVKAVRGERWLHLVAGGNRWAGLVFDEPLAISWYGADQLPAALRKCATLGLVLGYGCNGGRDASVFRATPLDVALTIRSLLPRR